MPCKMTSKFAIATILTTIFLLAAIACGTEQEDPFADFDETESKPATPAANGQGKSESSPTEDEPSTQSVPKTPTPAPVMLTARLTPTVIPTPTEFVRPTLFPTKVGDLPQHLSVPQEEIARAYANCNGLYTGGAEKERFQTAIKSMIRRPHEEHRIATFVLENCSGNFGIAHIEAQDKPTVTPDPETTERASIKTRQNHMLELMNQARASINIEPLNLNKSLAAQKHADVNRLTCSNGYWTTDGRNLNLRYSQEGGRQQTAFVIMGEWYCDGNPAKKSKTTWQRAMQNTIEKLATEGPSDFLSSNYSAVTIGHSQKENLHWIVLILEAKHVEMKKPVISTSGIINIQGKFLGKAAAEEQQEIHIQLLHAPGPQELARWQIAVAPKDEPGGSIAEIIIIPHYLENKPEYEQSVSRQTGFHLPHNLRPAPEKMGAPRSEEEVREMEQIKTLYRQSFENLNIEVPVIKAKTASISVNGDFSISAKILDVVKKHGEGIYTTIIFANVEGLPTEVGRTSFTISQSHSILIVPTPTPPPTPQN